MKDRWGIPVLRFHWQWSDHELNQVRHMQQTFRAILEAMGGRIATRRRAGRWPRRAQRWAWGRSPGSRRRRPDRRVRRPGSRTPRRVSRRPAPGGQRAGIRPRANAARPPISRGGAIIHEVGTVRMGDDPQTSPLNKYCQAHEVKNLFVADAAPFVSNADKNPTHTIIALAWRTAEYLAEEMRKGNV